MKLVFIYYCVLLIFMKIVCVLSQIKNGNKDTQNLIEGYSSAASPKKLTLEEAITKLTESVFQISTRLSILEDKLDLKFETLGVTLENQKSSMDIYNSKLDTLDSLAEKVKELDSKVDIETSIIKNAITTINGDLQELEERNFDSSIIGSQLQSKKDQPSIASGLTNEGLNDEGAVVGNSSSLHHEEEIRIGEMVVDRIESTLPRLLAAELNHFYLNMASKVEHSVRELQREVIQRLRRIEGTTKTTLVEVENGRQDISHLTHLHKSAYLNISSTLGQESSLRSKQTGDCLKGVLESDLKDFLLLINQNVTDSFLRTVSDYHRNMSTREEGNERSTSKIQGLGSNSEVWSGVFLKGVASSSSTQSSLKFPLVSSKHCLDLSALDTLQEVKQLLHTLVTKGEDMRRSLTKQTNEGVDLLKLLHQRFSVLLRRMNTDPGHGEALLAEVQELEHLVENSYSSILLAQNVFIESCHRIQQQQPSLEGKIVDILNQLVTNIDLGHQFNRKQLQEVRKLIVQIAEEEEPKNFSFLSSWIATKAASPSSEKFFGNVSKDRFFSNLVMTVAEANSTEEKLLEVINRLGDVEAELQTIGWKSSEFKDTADELLTNAKDLKGYSKDQIEIMQNLQEEILELIETYTEFMDSMTSNFQSGGTNRSFIDFDVVRNISRQKDVYDGQFYIPEECSLSILRQFRSSAPAGGTLLVQSNIKNGTTSPDTPEKVRLKKEVKDEIVQEHNQAINKDESLLDIKHPTKKRSGIARTLYPAVFKNKDMLMDQDFLDLQQHFNANPTKISNKNLFEVLNLSGIYKNDDEINKITILEDDFLD